MLQKYGFQVAEVQENLSAFQNNTQKMVMIHYCQEDLVIIEFTGQGTHTRKDSKSEALAEDI